MIDISVIARLIAERIRERTVINNLVPFDTGALRKSVNVEDGRQEGQAIINSNLIYARAVHDGRPAIVIRPKKKKYLRFKTKDGQWRTAKEVYQPAREARPFLQWGANIVNSEGYDFLYNHLRKDIGDELSRQITDSITVQVDL